MTEKYPECNFGKNRPYSQVEESFLPNLRDYYENPSKYWLDPFRIFGNLYYVGDKKVCSHLIDTGAGLILFDTGYRHALHLQLKSIQDLGFNPSDIKYIIHSHGHFDHFGGGNELRRMYGCKVFMSKVDTELLREKPERALMHYSPQPSDGICWPDVEIEDGMHVSLGNTDIRCVLTPGHTGGTMTFFFKVSDGNETLNAGYMGGVGFLSIFKDFCRQYDLPLDMCKKLGQSIKLVWNEKVDITLGNHPNHNCTVEKRQFMIENPGSNPFVNPQSWHIFLTSLEERRKSFEELGY